MHADWINPFVIATIAVFSKMLNCEIERGVPTAKNCLQPTHDVSGVMGLKGNASGTVVVSMSRNAALKATDAMTGTAPTSVDADVVDVVGEITNMVAGAAKAQLEELAMTISLPTVLTGKSHVLDFPRDVAIISIPFQSTWGPLTVDVSLCDTRGRC